MVDGRIVEDISDDDHEATRGGWLVGVQYALPLERHLRFGVDLTYRNVPTVDAVPDVTGSDFLAATLVVQIRP
jgi:hypothetical protein